MNVEFDFEDVVPKVQRAHSRANRADAEDAVMHAVEQLIAAGKPLNTANVVQGGKCRLIDAFRHKERGNSSLDAALESDVDSSPVELAVTEVDYETHVRVSDVRRNPVLALKADRVERGSYPENRRAGSACPATRYPLDVVERARALRAENVPYKDIVDRLGGSVHIRTVEKWCREGSRTLPSGGGWSRESIFDAFRAFVREEHRPPTHEDCERDPRLPVIKTLIRHVGHSRLSELALEMELAS